MKKRSLPARVALGLLTAAALTAGVCAAERVTRPVMPEGCVRLVISHTPDIAAGTRHAMGEPIDAEMISEIVICPDVPGSVGGPKFGGTLFIALAEEQRP